MASKISLSLGGARKPPPPTNGVKRSRAILHEEDEDNHVFGRSETVSHFDKKAGGAIDENNKKEKSAPLLIPRMANRDWKEAASKRRRQKSALPVDSERNGNMAEKMAEVEAADAAKKPGFGLNLYKTERNGDVAMENGTEPPTAQDTTDSNEAEIKPRTDDDMAMDALLGITRTRQDLIINAASDTMTEADAFQHDFQEAPDMATLDDYARIPVEDFGAAMLRGMGWKEGEGIGSQKGQVLPKTTNKLPARRANLLGIGATEDAALAQEMGAWGKAAKGSKEVKIYNPVLLRDKKTGAMYTEEELQRKQEKDERAKHEEAFERKERRRRRDEDDERDSRDRRRNGDDRNHRGHGSRRSEEEESEGEYHYRKERERRKRREEDTRDRERDRPRRDDEKYRDSHRHREHRDHRERHRERR